MTERILSPDGTQYWNGTSWVHVHERSAPAVAAPPHVMTHPVGPTAPLPMRGQGAGTVAPAGANGWAATKWAWLLALSPLVAGVVLGPLAIAALFGTDVITVGDVIGFAVGIAAVIAATVFCGRDLDSLRARGFKVDHIWTVAVLFIYVIGAPAYLIYRSVKARSTWLIPATWFTLVALNLVAAVLFTNADGTIRNPLQTTPALDVPALEADLASEVRELGARGVEVDCPDDEAYDDGDMVICDVTTSSDGQLEIVLDMRNDGYFMWEVQQS